MVTVREVFDYGAYVMLDEYNNLRAFLPWSEVTSRWVKDIREVLREGMKVVAKVIRVDKTKMQVDVSTKRVFDDEKKRKMIEYKQKQKAMKLMEIAAQRLGRRVEEVLERCWWKLEERYGDAYFALERAAVEGPGVLLEAGVPEELAYVLAEEATKRFEPKRVTVQGLIVLRSLAGDGVKRVKRVLEEVSSLSSDSARVRIYTAGAPKYVVEIEASDYKTAERVLEEAVGRARELAKSLGLEFDFKRQV